MANPSKAKGTSAESAVVKYMRLNGFGGADRQPLRGNRDAGDIGLTAGIVIEVKAHKSAGTGQPAAGQLFDWMAQAECERVNAGAAMCPLIVKRSGTLDVGRWWAYMTAADTAQLLNGAPLWIEHPHAGAPICMSVAAMVSFLRSNGYGDPLEQAS